MTGNARWAYTVLLAFLGVYFFPSRIGPLAYFMKFYFNGKLTNYLNSLCEEIHCHKQSCTPSKVHKTIRNFFAYFQYFLYYGT